MGARWLGDVWRPADLHSVDLRGRERLAELREAVINRPRGAGRDPLKPGSWASGAAFTTADTVELTGLRADAGAFRQVPAVVCQLHAAYLHSVGLAWALEFVQLLLRHDVFAGSYKLLVSRLDLYADFQGWVPVLEDLHRFVGYGRNRCGFEERNEAFTAGDRLTGLMFGRDALVARLYDKTQEIRRRGISWLPDLRGADTQSGPSGGWNSSSGARSWSSSTCGVSRIRWPRFRISGVTP